MAGPLWQQLLDFLKLQETLDAIAAGGKQANVDIESLRASLESAAHDIPAIRDALDFVKTAFETPGTEIIGGVNIFRSAALARGVRGADLERAAKALRKRVFEGKESLDAVRRDAGQEVAQEVQRQVAAKPDLFGPAFVAAVRGAAAGVGIAILAQIGEEPVLGRPPKPSYWDERRAEFEKAGAEAAAAYESFEKWRKGVRAQVYGEAPPTIPTPPEPELISAGAPMRKYALGESIEDTARRFYEGDVRAAIAYQGVDGPTLDKTKASRDEKGQRVYAVNKVYGGPIWLPLDDSYPQGSVTLNMLSELAFAAASGDTLKTADVLGKLEKVTPEMRVLVRSVLPKVFERFAPPVATKKLVDAWVLTEVTNEETARRNKAVTVQMNDELENTFGVLNGRAPTKDEALLLYGSVTNAQGYQVIQPSYGQIVPDSVKRVAHYRGMLLPNEHPSEVMEGNTLTLTEIVDQLTNTLEASRDVEFKKPYYGDDMLLDQGRVVAAARRYQNTNRQTFGRIVKSQREAQMVLAQGDEPSTVLGHGEPLSPDEWLVQDSARAKTDRQLLEAAEDAKARARRDAAKSEAKQDVIKHAADIREAIDKLTEIAKGQEPGTSMREYIYNNYDFLADQIVTKGMKPDEAIMYWHRIDAERKREKAQAERVTWADIGGMPEDERAWAALGYYRRGPDGRLHQDSAGIKFLARQAGESTGDYWVRAQGALGAKVKNLPPIEGMPKGAFEAAGLDTGNPANLLANLYRTGALGIAPMTLQNSQDLWRDYQTMVEFQAQQVAPNQQEAYRNAAYAKWPRLLETIDARLGVPKAKGDPAEILTEEAYRKQQAAEMIRQADVPAIVGVTKISDYSTGGTIFSESMKRKAAIPRAEIPLQEIQKREEAIVSDYRKALEQPAVQRQMAVEENLRAGANPAALASAVAWEAQQAAQRMMFQLEQEERPRREAAAHAAAEEAQAEFERTRPKPQPFRPTFWRFGPSFGRR